MKNSENVTEVTVMPTIEVCAKKVENKNDKDYQKVVVTLIQSVKRKCPVTLKTATFPTTDYTFSAFYEGQLNLTKLGKIVGGRILRIYNAQKEAEAKGGKKNHFKLSKRGLWSCDVEIENKVGKLEFVENILFDVRPQMFENDQLSGFLQVIFDLQNEQNMPIFLD